MVNDFLAFATAPGANVIAQSDYVADPIVPAGFASGMLPSAKTNKIWRQASFVAASVAHLIQSTLSIDVLDNGDLGTFSDNLAATIEALASGGHGIPEAPEDGAVYGRQQDAWARVVALAGDTMLGPLSLVGTPTSATHAASKGYIDTIAAGLAPRNSPTFTGTPVAPTAAVSTNTTQLATCAFVIAQVAASTAGVSSITAGAGLAGGGTGAATLSIATGGVTSAMLAQMPARTVKGNMNTGAAAAADVPLTTLLTTMGAAPSASPVFSGTPTGPTAAAGTSTGQLATTQFVTSAVTGMLPLTGGALTGSLGAPRITLTGSNPGYAFYRIEGAEYWEWHATGTRASLYSSMGAADHLNVYSDGTVEARTKFQSLNYIVVGPSGSYLSMVDNGESHINSINALHINDGTTKPIYFGGDLNTGSRWVFTTTLIADSVVQAGWHVVPSSDNVGAVGASGQAWAQMSTYWYITVSGRDRKQDIRTTSTTAALEKVNALRSVGYRWREQPLLTEKGPRPEGPSIVHHGFIADEVAAVFGADWGGYTCTEDADGNPCEGIAYNELTAVLWAAVQELTAKVARLEGKAVNGAADQ